MGVGDQWTWTWLALPSLTLQWAQCSEWRSLTPCLSPHVPQKCSIGIVKGTRESGKETIWPRRNVLYWCLSWPSRKKSRSAQLLRSPHGNMWQMALRTVHTWALHWEVALWTRTKLPSAHWPKQWWGGQYGASKWWLRKGTASCPVFSLTSGCSN